MKNGAVNILFRMDDLSHFLNHFEGSPAHAGIKISGSRHEIACHFG